MAFSGQKPKPKPVRQALKIHDTTRMWDRIDDEDLLGFQKM
jgi:hypothetical protein